MNAWKRDDRIVLTAKVDKDGILGQIAKISALEELLRNEVWKLNRMISVEEKAPLDTERNKGEEFQQAVDCAAQHIRTFLAQGTNKVTADLGEVCTCCSLRKDGRCKDFDWLKRLDPILSQSTVKLSVCNAGKSNYE